MSYGDNQYRLTAENGVLKFELYLNGTPINVTASLPSTNVWHLIVGTWDGSTLTLYVDNVAVATNTGATGAIATTTGALFIGNKNNVSTNAGNTFNGTIDDVRLYSRAINATEVTALYSDATGSPLVLTGPVNYLKLDGDGVHVDIWNNSTGTSSFIQYQLSAITTMGFVGTSGNDSLTIDLSTGDPLVPSGMSFDGRGGFNTLTIIGTTGNDAIYVTASTVTIGGATIAYANTQNLFINGNGGTDSLSISGGAVSLPVPSGSAINTINLSSLSITGSGSKLSVPSPGVSHNGRDLLVVSSLNISGGTLDLGGNDMIVRGGSLANITTLVAAGFNGGAWNGIGINSSAAGADTAHLTALGVIANNLYGGSGQPQFDGTNPSTGDILIKYTFYGDSNLNGAVDGSDYSRIDTAYMADLHNPGAMTGWYNGDFNYDQTVNGSDYTLMDNAFNTQAGPLAQIASAKSQLSVEAIAPPMLISEGTISAHASDDLTMDEKLKARKVKWGRCASEIDTVTARAERPGIDR